MARQGKKHLSGRGDFFIEISVGTEGLEPDKKQPPGLSGGGCFYKEDSFAYSSFLNIRLARSSGVTFLYLKYA